MPKFYRKRSYADRKAVDMLLNYGFCEHCAEWVRGDLIKEPCRRCKWIFAGDVDGWRPKKK